MSKTINIRARTGVNALPVYDRITVTDTDAYHLIIEMADLASIPGSVILRFVRSDDVTIEHWVDPANVVGNLIYHTLSEQQTAVVGPLQMYVRIVSGETELYTAALIIFTDVVPLAGGDTTPTEADVSLVASIAAVEAARVIAENERQQAETDRLMAEGERYDAEYARWQAEQTRVSEENSRVSAESKRAVWEAYNAGKVYAVGEKVVYNGSSYIMHSASGVSGTLPTNATYWRLIASAGETGNGVLTGYSIASAESAIAASDTVNAALGKLERKANNIKAGVLITGTNLSVYTGGGGAAGSNIWTKTLDGLTTRCQRAAIPRPSLEWSYGLLSIHLGTVADLQNKKFYLHRDQSASGLAFNTGAIRLSKTYYDWVNAFYLSDIYDEDEYYTVLDPYADCIAHGWAPTQNVYVMFFHEYGVGTGPTTVPAVDIKLHCIRVSPEALTDSAQSFIRAHTADYADLADKATRAVDSDHADDATVAVVANSAGYFAPFDEIITYAQSGGAIYSIDGYEMTVDYETAQANQPVVIVRRKLGTLQDLKNKILYLKATNRNDDLVTDKGADYTWAITLRNDTQWGDTKWIRPVASTLDGAEVEGLYEALIAAGGTDSSPVYLMLCNMYVYTNQLPYSCHLTGFSAIPDESASIRAGSLNGFSISEYNDFKAAAEDAGISSARRIVCWGDSLTAGGGWTTQLQTLSGVPVYNAGTGGENARTIMARQGGDAMLINDVTIPATTTPVTLKLYTDGGFDTVFGYKATPLMQGGSNHVNPVRIGDIEGTLAWTGSTYNDPAGTWTFTRTTAGNTAEITRPTVIQTNYDRNYNGGIMVVFMGQNGGYTDNTDLVNMHKLMKEHSFCRHMVVLGLSSGSTSTRADYETAMKSAFGRDFISLREYLATAIYAGETIVSCYGLEDAGLTATQADLDAIATGTVPPQLLSDSVHYTTACKTVIGTMLYNKMHELNYV